MAHHSSVSEEGISIEIQARRSRWVKWFFGAKKRFYTSILNGTRTSNHLHLVIKDDKGALGWDVVGANGTDELREPETAWEAKFCVENTSLSGENTFSGPFLFQDR